MSKVAATQPQSRLVVWVAAVVGAGVLVFAGSAVLIRLAVVLGPSMPAPRVVAIILALIQVIFGVLVILIGGIAVGLSQWDVPF